MDTATHSVLHPDDRLEPKSWLRSSAHGSGPITRARILLDLDEGYSIPQVAQRQRVGHATVSRWKARYLAEGIDSLADRPRSGRPSVIEPDTVQRVLVHGPTTGAQAVNVLS